MQDSVGVRSAWQRHVCSFARWWGRESARGWRAARARRRSRPARPKKWGSSRRPVGSTKSGSIAARRFCRARRRCRRPSRTRHVPPGSKCGTPSFRRSPARAASTRIARNVRDAARRPELSVATAGAASSLSSIPKSRSTAVANRSRSPNLIASPSSKRAREASWRARRTTPVRPRYGRRTPRRFRCRPARCSIRASRRRAGAVASRFAATAGARSLHPARRSNGRVVDRALRLGAVQALRRLPGLGALAGGAVHCAAGGSKVRRRTRAARC